MKIIKEQKAGIIGYFEGQQFRQYDDSITVKFKNEEEKDNNRVVNHNGINYYFGSSNRNNDGTYTATMWKKKPVW